MKGNIVILGAGESGTGAALLAQAQGFDVLVSDFGSIAPQYREELEQASIAYEEGGHTEDKVLAATEIIKSPGIPDTVPLVTKARAQGISVVSEIEFAGRYIAPEAKTVLITGTNGKTTTTMLTHHLLVSAGKKAALGGNVGVSLARLVLEGGYDIYVIEVSSFQLDGMVDFHANLATVLNITADHLDRYDYQMGRYVDSKFRVLQNMTEADEFVYSLDDPVVSEEVKKRQPQVRMHTVTRAEDDDTDAALMGETLVIRSVDRQCDWYYPTESMALQGPHNETNTMVAATFAKLLGVGEESIREAVKTFRNAPHRMEYVGTIQGVDFVNDSKGTNVDSVKQSLASYPGKTIVWVAGGIDKGNDYEVLRPLVEANVRGLVCLGKDNTKLHAFVEGMGKPVEETQDVEASIELSLAMAQPGDVVLLSPACSSFDLFKNFAQRGDLWREAVLKMRDRGRGTRDEERFNELTNNSIDE